jgi:hypothetical protein
MSARPGCETPGRRTLHRQATVGGPPWPLPVALLLSAALAYVAGACALLVAAPDLARGVYYGPAQLGAVHLLALGFLTVTITGALLQLVPVLLRTALGTTARAAVAGGLLAAGAWALALGLWADVTVAVAAGGTALVAGGALLLGDLAAALLRARRAGTLGAPGAGIALCGAWFALVLVLGAAMAADHAHPYLEGDRLRLIAAHGVVGALGWIGGAILAVALRLAPMFALSHGYARRPGIAALAVWHLSVPVIAVGLYGGHDAVARAGGVLLLGACGLALWFALGVARHRRRRVEAPMVHLVLGIACVAAADALLLAAPAAGADAARTAAAAGVLVLVGLGCGVTAGHLFKVLPMLVWTGRFAHLAGTPGAPRLSDLFPHRLAAAEQVCFAAGLALLTGGVLAGAPLAARAGAALLALAAAVVLVAAVACAARRVPAAPPSAAAAAPSATAPMPSGS